MVAIKKGRPPLQLHKLLTCGTLGSHQQSLDTCAGGGLLISAIFGVLFFSESFEGRVMPIATIVAGVVLLTI